ncbi:MAG: flagellar motor protein MotB [Gemmobacter sp.]
MAGQSNAAPVIIKRRKIIRAGGHHGGAWKVAYADFVTAMMAFFLLMWLLNATTETQRKGLADFFNPSVPVNRISGGGEGMFGGDSIFADDTLAFSGTGARVHLPPDSAAAGAEPGGAEDADGMLAEVEQLLSGLSGESMETEYLLRHVVSRLTDEGLVIELSDLEDAPLFTGDGAEPAPVLIELSSMLAEVFSHVDNGVAVNGHVRAYPIMLVENPVWDLSMRRAGAMHRLLTIAGLPPERVRRVAGHADRKPVAANPMAVRNNRLELILLHRDR